MSRRRSWALTLLAALPLAACTDSPPAFTPHTASAPATPGVAPQVRLVAFDSCSELHRSLRQAAQQNVTPWGMPGQEVMLAAGRANAASGMMAEKADAAPAHSSTNIHEAGADEPDIVKTDGRRIVTIAGGSLRVIDPASRTETGRLDLGTDLAGESKLLLSGDRALVLTSGTGRLLTSADVLLVDLTGPPRLLSRYHGDGLVIDARQTGSVARVVLSSRPRIDFPFRAQDDDGLLRENRKAITSAPLDAWLPHWDITTGSSTTTSRLACEAVSRPTSFTGAALVRVLTFDLAADALDDGSPVAVVSDGDTVYGTPTSLYLASNQSWRMNALPQARVRAKAAPDTEIFQFALPPAGKPRFVASGRVPGALINQYAMSEWDGHLRVATTDPAKDASAVRVLRTQGDKLVQVGEVGGLGKNEKIYSVRFIGPRGYVVTFRQTDPLYSLDLADPARPRVTGELKITGYSAHLQPVGENRLVGIGQEASSQGMRQGTQISLFDVTDPANPRRLARHLVGRTSMSEAEYDPHALLWWPATGQLVAPLDTGGPLVLKVGPDSLGAAQQLTVPGGMTRRTLVIGPELWTLTDTGLMVSGLSALDRRGWVPLT